MNSIKALIGFHRDRPGSVQARMLLTNWKETTRRLVRVIAKEHARLEAASTPVEK